jgi:predicted CoA-binding protein
MSAIQDFLAQTRIAVIGVSHDPREISRALFKELRTRGYDTVPVNPSLKEVDGIPCFAHLRDIQPPVTAALLMTAPTVTEQVVEECAEAGTSKLWMYSAGKSGAVSEHAINFCESRGMTVIPGECPFMFLQGAGWFHRMHGFIRKIRGAYPQ